MRSNFFVFYSYLAVLQCDIWETVPQPQGHEDLLSCLLQKSYSFSSYIYKALWAIWINFYIRCEEMTQLVLLHVHIQLFFHTFCWKNHSIPFYYLGTFLKISWLQCRIYFSTFNFIALIFLSIPCQNHSLG